jgi:hypothetical protein
MTSTHENTQPKNISAMEKSRPPTGIFIYPYKVVGNCLFMEQIIKGTPINKKLCNFAAWITGEIIQYDGIDTEVLVKIVGIHASGRMLPEVTIPLSRLGSFEWVDRWGAVGGTSKAIATLRFFITGGKEKAWQKGGHSFHLIPAAVPPRKSRNPLRH